MAHKKETVQGTQLQAAKKNNNVHIHKTIHLDRQSNT